MRCAGCRGEPLRIVTSGKGGMPDVPGATVLERRRHMRAHLDHIRRLLLAEPRGHFDHYGSVITPGAPGTAFGVIFMHNEGRCCCPTRAAFARVGNNAATIACVRRCLLACGGG